MLGVHRMFFVHAFVAMLVSDRAGILKLSLVFARKAGLDESGEENVNVSRK